jgi:hypothetical protein
MRLHVRRDYSSDNSVVVPRIQFLAIEVARLREGLNDWVTKATALNVQQASSLVTDEPTPAAATDAATETKTDATPAASATATAAATATTTPAPAKSA